MIHVKESSKQTLYIEEDFFIIYQFCNSFLASVDGIDVCIKNETFSENMQIFKLTQHKIKRPSTWRFSHTTQSKQNKNVGSQSVEQPSMEQK